MNLRKTILSLLAAGFLACLAASAVLAFYPDYLKDGRTYDQESNYFRWQGDVHYVNLYHRDNTTLPPSEGGGSCASGCTENVTRINDGGSVSGNFTYLKSLNIQLAYSGRDDVGTAVLRACGQIFYEINLYQRGAGTPGFNNFPVPAWNVPTSGDCVWSITAEGGYVDFRAITTTFLTTPPPTVDFRVNGGDGPISTQAPGSFTLGWTSTNAAACTSTGSWSGSQPTQGSQAFSGISGGSYTYTLTCSNPAGSASDSVSVTVIAPPTVSVSAPSSLTAPASFTASWTSTNASTCTGSERFAGLTGINASKVEANLPPGTYDYSVLCMNAIGQTASAMKRTMVYAAPAVTLTMNGVDGEAFTLPGPASYQVAWTSTGTATCTGSGRLVGASGINGARTEANIPGGTTYDYSVTCLNPAGASAADSLRVVVEQAALPLSGSISAHFSRLLLYGPRLGQPAQTLTGSVSGGLPPYAVQVKLRSPSGLISAYPRSEPTWSVSPANSGDVYLGTTEEGAWTAWAEIEDSAGQFFRTSNITWEVAWFPVHGRP